MPGSLQRGTAWGEVSSSTLRDHAGSHVLCVASWARTKELRLAAAARATTSLGTPGGGQRPTRLATAINVITAGLGG